MAFYRDLIHGLIKQEILKFTAFSSLDHSPSRGTTQNRDFLCQIFGFRSDVDKVSFLLGCDESLSVWYLKKSPPFYLKTPGTKYPMMEHHIPGEITPQYVFGLTGPPRISSFLGCDTVQNVTHSRAF
jgi:hypothetical protein